MCDTSLLNILLSVISTSLNTLSMTVLNWKHCQRAFFEFAFTRDRFLKQNFVTKSNLYLLLFIVESLMCGNLNFVNTIWSYLTLTCKKNPDTVEMLWKYSPILLEKNWKWKWQMSGLFTTCKNPESESNSGTTISKDKLFKNLIKLLL